MKWAVSELERARSRRSPEGSAPPRCEREARVDGSQLFFFCAAGALTSTFTSPSPALTMPICCAAA